MGTRESVNSQFDDRMAWASSDLEHENSREIHRDIERTRSLMDRTIDELTARLQPSELMREVWGYFKSSSSERAQRARSRVGHAVRSGVHSGGEAVSEGVQESAEAVIGCVRRNPLPSAIVGAGLGYLLYNELLREDQPEEHPSRRMGPQGYEAEGVGMAYGGEPTSARMAEVEVFAPEAAIVLPAGSDIESPKYPLEPSSDGSARSRAASAASKAAQGAGSAASSAKHAAGSAASSVSDAASTAGHAASDAGRSAYGAVRGTGQSVSHAASAGYRQVSHQASHLGEMTAERLRAARQAAGRGASYTRDASREATEQYPLLVGLGCAAAGLMAGFMLPRTRREDETFGETAHDIRSRGYEMGADAIERGREVASTTAAAALGRAEQEGLTPSALADHVGNVAKKVAESAKAAVREEGLTSDELARKAGAVKEEVKTTAQHESAQ